MALKAVLVSEVPSLGQIPETPTFRSSSCISSDESARVTLQSSKFMVIGHRGRGMNALASPDHRLKIVKENTVLSFNEAGRFPVDFVEFDVQVCLDPYIPGPLSAAPNSVPALSQHLIPFYAVRREHDEKDDKIFNLAAVNYFLRPQPILIARDHRIRIMIFSNHEVTKEGTPIVFHDIFILSEEGGIISEKRVTDLSLEEFLAHGLQRDASRGEKSLHRKTKDGKMFHWKVENDDHLCTLQEVFLKVNAKLGFNIELKFDDHRSYSQEELLQTLQAILQVVFEFANGRPIIFSTFHPDAAHLMRKLQDTYPVFFLTNGGNEAYSDERRNSLEAAIMHCLAGQLHGIVSEVRGVFRNPSLIPRIKESNLSLLTYGQLNNVAEAVYMQHVMGIDGVIVDLVEEITEAVSDLTVDGEEDTFSPGADGKRPAIRPKFSQRELAFLLKLIPELVHHS